VIVECQIVTNHDNVIAGVTIGWSNPDWDKSTIGISPEERESQDVAGAAREEDPVR
jgi:hypothetical protein